ncbi:GDSL esterase/lipase [Senna tora]|uniref:GDSL esterase/lipase n=1 Tax=Senna tora TaxID=362788 RepID=A0A834TUY8_9FABA|nr:GDSL esterase/lipase [Senna tora]
MAKSFLLLLLFLGMVGLSLNDNTDPLVPALYIFGDSTFDVGTNNFLSDSKAKADYKYYGIDFPNSEATGRFSNGYNTADYVAKLLGFDLSPPPFFYLAQNDSNHFKSEILKGVNFASAGSGLQDNTGKDLFTKVIAMGEQIQQFASVQGNISEYLNDTAEARVKNSLFLFSVGSNDIFEFFAANPSANDTQIQLFLNTLITTYETHLENVVKLGARKLGIVSVPPIGCVPVLRLKNAIQNFECVNGLNAFALAFQTALETLLQNLKSQWPDLNYSLGKSFELTITMIHNPRLKEVRSACCGNSSATLRAKIDCGPNTELCENRRKYLFWDSHHPTDAASKLAALTLVTGGPEFVTPTNFSLLVLPS